MSGTSLWLCVKIERDSEISFQIKVIFLNFISEVGDTPKTIPGKLVGLFRYKNIKG